MLSILISVFFEQRSIFHFFSKFKYMQGTFGNISSAVQFHNFFTPAGFSARNAYEDFLVYTTLRKACGMDKAETGEDESNAMDDLKTVKKTGKSDDYG